MISIPCHLPLSGSRGQRLPVSLQQPPFLRARLLAIRVDRPLHQSNTHAMESRLEPLHSRVTPRCASRGKSLSVADYPKVWLLRNLAESDKHLHSHHSRVRVRAPVAICTLKLLDGGFFQRDLAMAIRSANIPWPA